MRNAIVCRTRFKRTSPVFGVQSVSLLSAIALCVAMSPLSANANVFSSSSSRLDKRPAMMPLRRLGLMPVAQNIQDARKTLTDQTTLKGILAQPFTQEEFSQRLNTQLKAVADASGRFWTMDAISGESVSGRNPGTGELSSFQRAQLVREYDLDGWLKSEIYFTADHTAVRIAIVSPQGNQVIAREDILLPFGVDWDAIANAFAQAVGRMGDTIGHDGRVVFDNNDLVGIDFGSERGISVGQRLKAGLVLQGAAHPQTGEVIRYQRTPLLELEVVETKQGASLCKKVAVDPDLMKQAETHYGTGSERKVPLLVWREDFKRVDPVWQAGRGQGRVDAGSSGFAERSVAGEAPASRLTPVAPAAKSSAPSASEKAPDTPPAQVAMVGGNNPFSAPSFSQRDSSAPGASIKIGAGVASGTLELSKGPVSSSLPSFLINHVWVKDGFRYSPEWDINYGVEYLNFSGDAQGSRITGRLAMMASGEVLSVPDLPLRWGAEGQLSSGTVKTEKSKKTLDEFELLGVVSTNRNFEGGWALEAELKPSITGILESAFGYELALDVHPGMAPKGLGVQWRMLDDGDRWTEWSLGVSWKLGVVE